MKMAVFQWFRCFVGSPPFAACSWPLGLLLASWPVAGLLLASSPLAGLLLASGFLLASCWPLPGLLLASCWLLAGFLLASCWALAGYKPSTKISLENRCKAPNACKARIRPARKASRAGKPGFVGLVLKELEAGRTLHGPGQ